MTAKMWAAAMFGGWVLLLASWFLVDDQLGAVVLLAAALVMFGIAGLTLLRSRKADR